MLRANLFPGTWFNVRCSAGPSCSPKVRGYSVQRTDRCWTSYWLSTIVETSCTSRSGHSSPQPPPTPTPATEPSIPLGLASIAKHFSNLFTLFRCYSQFE